MTEYVALSEIDSAIRRTRDLLWPFRKGIWLRIALIALFIGWGGAGFPQPTWSSDSDFPSDAFTGFSTPGALPDMAGLIIAVFLLIIALALLYMLIGSIFQFVFVDCIRMRNVKIRDYFSPRAGKGIRLFLFQIGIAVLFLLLLAALIIPFIILARGFAFPAAVSLLLFLPVLIILAIIVGIIQVITIDFVVPIMIQKDCGVIDGWKEFYSIISTQWMQGIIYLIVRFLAALGAGVVMILLTLLALGIVAIPFLVVGFILYAAMPMANISILLPLLIPYLIIAIPVVLLISVPFVTFFRTYSLAVLGRLDSGYALLPEEEEATG
ncbi:MAG: hypothetical protein XE11_1613 [Methanomicrobiales archaeon 53_19]|jgi:hypothetical protein|uniref:DUF7544 domain-containing protein n=1 Tax=Methanocalculus sp. TaxID=2004547 RepID=UPI0007463730|nr:hypothetical protein [Methanocalculus sp.]KUK71025.1 MAG: hypothetical protein XD88_0291 [Methanocalculus sp. 52_23]KUL02801.1 MAG: hypothetical protein XE11_1613 [Methanomicrobiales archaeon 53_19]HIJ06621.1 hypothetical protein [Methanocalculus sp.]